MMEKIIYAAVIFDNNGYPMIFTEEDHSSCMLNAMMFFHTTHKTLKERAQLKEDAVKGFITSSKRFVNRSEAFNIAKAANQLKPNFVINELYSEDVIYDEEGRM